MILFKNIFYFNALCFFFALGIGETQAQNADVGQGGWLRLQDMVPSREAAAPIVDGAENEIQWFNEGSTTENQYVRTFSSLSQLVHAHHWDAVLQVTVEDTTPQGRFYRAVALAQTGNLPAAVALLDGIRDGNRAFVRAAETYRVLLLQYQTPPPEMGGRPLDIAVLLPFSGPHAAIGDTLLNALQLAVFDDFPQVTLYPFDTGSDAATARQAVEQAASSQVQAMIGPLFSAQVEAVQATVQRLGIPMLALSSDHKAAGAGVHVFNYRPEAQTRLVTRHALQEGARRFAALVPSTPYGYEVLEIFQDTVVRGGGLVENVAFFNPDKADITEALDQLFPRPVETQDEDETTAAAALGISGTYDALFLPTDAAHLPLVTSQMALYDVDRMTEMLTLGTAAWTEKDMAGGYSYMRDGRFPLPARDPGFVATYEAAYGVQPPAITQVAYAAVQVLVQAHNRIGGLSQNLLHPAGFTTLSGPVRLRADGLPERGYPLHQVTQRRFIHVKQKHETSWGEKIHPPLPHPLDPTERRSRGIFSRGVEEDGFRFIPWGN